MMIFLLFGSAVTISALVQGNDVDEKKRANAPTCLDTSLRDQLPTSAPPLDIPSLPPYYPPYPAKFGPSDKTRPTRTHDKKSMVPAVFYADDSSETDRYEPGYESRSGPREWKENQVPTRKDEDIFYRLTSISTETPAVLLGIRNADAIKGAPEKKFTDSHEKSANEIKDDDYFPAHYPSSHQMLLLRKGLRKSLLLSKPRKSSKNDTMIETDSKRSSSIDLEHFASKPIKTSTSRVAVRVYKD